MTKKTTVFDKYAIEQDMPLSVPATFAPYVQVPPGGRILDVGCGDGRFLTFCREVVPQGFSVGMDISWIRVQRVARQGFIVLQADSERLPFASQTFHLVLLIEVVEHTQYPEAVMAEIARVLVPDGRLILTTPNYPIKRAYDWLSYLRGTRSSPGDDPTHFSPFSARRIKSLCARHFATVDGQIHHIAGEGRWPALARLRSVPLVGDLIGHKIMVFCHKPRQKAYR